jgi:hypothetical protein
MVIGVSALLDINRAPALVAYNGFQLLRLYHDGLVLLQEYPPQSLVRARTMVNAGELLTLGLKLRRILRKCRIVKSEL